MYLCRKVTIHVVEMNVAHNSKKSKGTMQVTYHAYLASMRRLSYTPKLM